MKRLKTINKLFIIILSLLIISGTPALAVNSGSNNGSASNTTASANVDVDVNWDAYTWVAIYISQGTVDLGTIDEANYDEITNTFSPINNTSAGTLFAATNDPDGFTVDISAKDENDNINDLSDLYVSGNGGADWSSLSGGSLDSFIDKSSANITTKSLGYKYEVDVNDEPGNYSVTLTYTVTSK